MTTATSTPLRENIAILTSPNKTLHIRPVPVPSISPTECLIHVRATGICGSDVHFWKEGGIGDSVIKEGEELGLGHESSGVVVGVGSEVVAKEGEGGGWRLGEFLFFFVSFLFLNLGSLVLFKICGGDG